MAFFGNLFLATIYFLTAIVGLSLEPVSGFATFVWPPTGIAIASLLLFGYRFAPGVALGAFFANLVTGAPALVALGIAIGNTLEAVLAKYLLDRVDFDKNLDNVKDVLYFVLLGVFSATIVSATIGVSSLWFGDVIMGEAYLDTWTTWWIGDMLGALIIAPLILLWFGKKDLKNELSGRFWELTSLLLVIFVVSAVIFWDLLFSTRFVPISYIAFLPLIWAALSFSPRWAITASFIMSAIAITGAITGFGPFTGPILADVFLQLQIFMATIILVSLLLAAAISEIRRAEELEKEFIAIASHQLRTPLTSIRWEAERFLKNEPSVTEKGRGYLDNILLATKNLSDLVSLLLNVARFEGNKIAVIPKQIDAVGYIKKYIQEYEPFAKQKEASLVLKQAPPELKVVLDEALFEIILQSILSNAIEYNIHHGYIEISLKKNKKHFVLEVKDTGIGIPQKDFPRVFEKFFRASNAAPLKSSGTGLGLFFAKRAVERLGGRIWFESIEGKGSTFFVELPMVSKAKNGKSVLFTS